VIQDLVRENVVVAEAGGNRAGRTIATASGWTWALFLSLARQYLEGPQKFRFLGSHSPRAFWPAMSRAIWNPAGGFEQRPGARGLLPIPVGRPSALNHALFTQTDRYLAPETESRPGYLDRERTRVVQMNRLVGDCWSAWRPTWSTRSSRSSCS